VVAAALALATTAAAQMPDLSQMNGRSLPAPDAPAGSASVRVMRQTLGNNVVGQAVTLTAADGGAVGTKTTDEGGRATFEGLRPGTAYIATAVVGGERLVSQPFTQPVSGGVRVVLIAGLGAATATPGAPAQAPKPAVPTQVTAPAPTPAPAAAAPALSQEEIEKMVKEEMARREASIRKKKEAELRKYQQELERLQAEAKKRKQAADAAASEGEPPPQ